MGCGGSVEEQAAIGRAAADWQAANTPTPTAQTASPPGAPFQPFQSQVPVAQPQFVPVPVAQAAVPVAGNRFDPDTGKELPKFDPATGKQNW